MNIQSTNPTAPRWHPLPAPAPVPTSYGRLWLVAMGLVATCAVVVIVMTA